MTTFRTWLGFTVALLAAPCAAMAASPARPTLAGTVFVGEDKDHLEVINSQFRKTKDGYYAISWISVVRDAPPDQYSDTMGIVDCEAREWVFMSRMETNSADEGGGTYIYSHFDEKWFQPFLPGLLAPAFFCDNRGRMKSLGRSVTKAEFESIEAWVAEIRRQWQAEDQ
jgi:hypothetical protein